MKATVAAVLVFMIAVAFRWSSCHESYWVDELHTAWCVDEALRDVAPRAAMGHQSPFYFWGLWCYRSLVGDGEWAMRMSSVVATAAAAGMVTFGLARQGGVWGGLAGGFVLAIDANSIFFGTELRPYAWVMLITAAWLMAVTWRIHDASDGDVWWPTVMAASVIGWVHPTAAALPLLAMFGMSVCRRSIEASVRRIIAGWVCVSVSMAMLWWLVIGDTWSDRGQWESFAVATGGSDFVDLWNWGPLVLVPALSLWTACWLGRNGRSGGKGARFGLTALLAIVVVTTAFFVASRYVGIHLWHRRYMVALLPAQAIAVGWAVSVWEGQSDRGRVLAILLAILLAIFLVGWSAIGQHAWQRVLLGQPMITRGEDWRSASDWIEQQFGQPNLIWVDSGLIEARSLKLVMPDEKSLPPSEEGDQKLSRYLCYPMLGPYRVGRRHQPVSMADMISGQRKLVGESGIAIVRSPAASVAAGLDGQNVQVASFGRVCVVVWPGRSETLPPFGPTQLPMTIKQRFPKQTTVANGRPR